MQTMIHKNINVSQTSINPYRFQLLAPSVYKSSNYKVSGNKIMFVVES